MITIQDNNYIGKVYSFHEVADLFPIANKPIKQLCEEDEHLLVFPFNISLNLLILVGYLETGKFCPVVQNKLYIQ